MATTSNPVLARVDFRPVSEAGAGTMTLGGAISKTLILLGILTATATFAWLQTGAGLAQPDKLGTLFLVGILGGFGVALYTIFRPEHAPVTAPIYAALEGLLPGALPSILVGVRFALGFMWLTLIVAETISANAGIGYLAMNAREFLQTDVVVLAILLSGCVVISG